MLLLIPLRFKQTIRNHILCGHRRPWLRPPRRRRRCCRSPSPKSVLIRFSLFDWLYELFSFWQISFASKVAAAQVLGCSGGQKERDENQSRRHSDEIGSGPDHRVGAWKNIKKWKITIFGGALVLWLWETTHVQEVMSSNPGTVFWMDMTLFHIDLL